MWGLCMQQAAYMHQLDGSASYVMPPVGLLSSCCELQHCSMRAAVKQPRLSATSAGTWRPEPPSSSICRWGQLPASAPRSASVRQLQLCSASARSPCPVAPTTLCTDTGTSLPAAACSASPAAPSGSPSTPAADQLTTVVSALQQQLLQQHDSCSPEPARSSLSTCFTCVQVCSRWTQLRP